MRNILNVSITVFIILICESFSNAQLLESLQSKKEQTTIIVKDVTDTTKISAVDIYRQLLISVERSNVGLKEISYQGPLAKLNKIEFVNNNKALLIGELPYGGISILIIDISANKILDNIRAYQYSISPQKNLLVYTTWFPRMGGKELSKSIFLIYDFNKTQKDNRLQFIDSYSYENAGIPIFPKNNVLYKTNDVNGIKEQIIKNNYSVNLDDEFFILSSFLWSNDEKKLVFFTFNNDNKTNYLIHMSFNNGIEYPTLNVYSIDLNDFIKWDIITDDMIKEISINPYKFGVNSLAWSGQDKIVIEPYPQFWLDKSIIMDISVIDK